MSYSLTAAVSAGGTITSTTLVVASAFPSMDRSFPPKPEWWGLCLLRHKWFSFDLLWAIALLIAGVTALV
jgi:hypothetical protein